VYRHCIYCSAPLGANEALERFPVGRTLAFDAGKGRLWAVCPKCARWNLAPIEERWEAVEDAERTFRDTRLRVQRENIGIASLRDGTRLVRIGTALLPEVAAWRYGREMWRRSRAERARDSASVAASVAAGGATLTAAVAGSAGFLASAGVGVGVGSGAGGAVVVGWGVVPLAAMVVDGVERRLGLLRASRAGRRPVHRLQADESPTGQALVLRRADLRGAYLSTDEETGEVVLRAPTLLLARDGGTPAPFTLRGPRVHPFLARTLVGVNSAGAAPRSVEYALDELGRAESADAYVAGLARERATLELPDDVPWRWISPKLDPYWTARADLEGVPAGDRFLWARKLGRGIVGGGYGGMVRGLALEIAVHEESERRALEGELALLESAWKEAEALAAIADGLADAPALPAPPAD